MQASEFKDTIRFWILSAFFLWFGLLSHPLRGQRPEKKDYIILGDTALSQGKVMGTPTENNSLVSFVRSRKTPVKTYSVSEVSEFRMSERVFFSKKVLVNGKEQLVFLESSLMLLMVFRFGG